MSQTITLPKLGFDMREGTFQNWVKKVGDSITAGEVIAEIESDKATIEVESTAGGVILQTLVNVGDTVPVGAPIAVVGEASEKPASAPASEAKQEAKPEASQPAAAPAPAPEPAPAAPASTQTAPAPAPVSKNGQQTAPQAQPQEDTSEFPGGVKASPIARRIAEEKGIDLRQVHGSGPGGRIVKTDVETFTTAAPAAAAQSAAPRPQAAQGPVPSGDGITELPLSRLRQRIATRMTESKQNVPHFYVTTEIDMAPALALRKQINEGLPEEQRVSVNDLVVKAVALTLRQFPNLNSHYYGDKLVRYDHINIGIAVALDAGGLMNVVAKDADITSISRMSQRNREMIASARSGKVRPEDVEGSTFTVSNLGPFDVESFVAIINPPEAGILAVASAKEIPVVINGEVKIATRMKVTLSVDHRVSDGAEGAKFLQMFKALLQAPMRLLI